MKKVSLFLTALLAAVHLRAQAPVWGTALGGGANDRGQSIAVDASGNTYTTGYLTLASGWDIFVRKQDATGTVIWSYTFGANSSDKGNGITVDAAGNVYVVGTFDGTIDFDPGASVFNLTGAADAFVLKLTSAGGFVWVNKMSDTGTDEANAVAVNSAGDVFVTGYLTTANADAFVTKFNSAGVVQWQVETVGSGTLDQGKSIKLDNANGVIVGGIFNSQMDVDPSGATLNLTPSGTGSEPFIWKLTDAGALVWGKTFGNSGNSNNELSAIDVDASNFTYVTGYFTSVVDFDPGAGTANVIANGTDAFLAKYDVNGNFSYVKTWGASSSTVFPKAIDVTTNGIYLGGYFSNSTDFDPGAGTFTLPNSSGVPNPFIMKLDINGNFKSAFDLVNTFSSTLGIVANATGNIYATGYFSPSGIDLDPWGGYYPISNPNSGTEQVFTVKYDSCFTPPFSFTPTTANLCPGGDLVLNVSQTIVGNSYRVYRNNVPYGTATPGTGTAMTINVSGLAQNDSITLFVVNGVCQDSMYGKTYISVGGVDIDSAMIRHYRLDNSFKDEVTGTVNASAASGNFVIDRLGNANFARDIQAANQGIDITPVARDTMTISFWMKGYVGNGSDSHILYNISTGYGNANSWALRTQYDAGSGKNNLTISTNGLGVVGNSGGVLSANTWNQIIYAKSGDKVKVYVNGVKVIDCANVVSFTTFPLQRFGTGQVGHIGGQMDDIRIFNYSFSDAQAAQAYALPYVWAPVANVGGCLGSAISITDSVQINGGVTYQWYKNGVAIAGATAQTYNIPSLAATDTGAYYLKVGKGCSFTKSQITKVGLGSNNSISGLSAWYKFDTNAADSSGNGNHATNNGATSTTNQFNVANKAFNFGSPNYISAPVSILSTPANKTVTMWFKKRTATSRGCLLWAGAGTPPGTPPGNSNPMIYLGQDDKLRGVIYTGNANQNASTFTITDTLWHMVALVTTSNNQALYFDGTLASNFTGTFNYSVTNLLIGTGRTNGWVSGTSTNVWDYFDGKMDEVRFYNASLTPAQITQLYNIEIGFTSQPQSVSTCTGGTATFTVTTAGNVTYQWKKNGTNIAGATSATYTDSNVQAADAGNYTCVISDACDGTSYTSNAAALTLSNPSAPTANGTSICSGNTASLTASGGTTYAWYAVLTGGTKLASTASYTTPTLSTTTTYYVENIVSGCTSARTAVTVTVNNATAPTANGTSICSGNTASLTASGGTTYAWYAVLTGGTKLASTASYTTPTLSTTTTYYVENIVSGCTSARTAVTVTVNNATAPTANGTSICSGNTASLTASGGTTYAWYTVASGGTSIASTASYTTPTLSTTTTYYVENIVSGCTSARTAVTVTVNNATAPTANGTSICSGNTASLTASGGTTYAWYTVASGGTSIASTASYTTPTLSTTTTYYVENIVSGCTSARTAVTVTVNNATAPTANGTSICSGNTASLTASGGTSYAWYAVLTGGTKLASTASYTTPTLSTTTTYYVENIVSGCTSARTAVTVTVNNATAPTANGTSICSGNTASLTASGGSSYAWYAVLTGGTKLASTASYTTPTLSTTTTYYVENIVSGCTSARTAVTVTVNNATAPTANGTSICSGNTASLTASGGTTYAWYTVASGGTSIASTASYTTPTLSTTTTYYVENIVSGCTSARTAVTVTVNNATAPTANGTSICSGNTASLTASGGTSYAWYAVLTGGTKLASTASYTTPTLSTTTTYYVENIASGCTSSRTAVTVTVNNATAPTAPDASICTNNSANLTASGGTSYAWYTVPTGGTSIASNANFITPILTSTTTYYVENIVSGCTSARTAVTVTVSSSVSAPVANGVSICSGNTASVTATGGSTYGWYAAPTGGTSIASGATLNTAALTNTTTYYVENVSGNCTSSRTAVTVTVNPIPSAPTANPVTICFGNTATLIASDGTDYVWYNLPSGGTALDTTANFSPTVNATTTFYVSNLINGCESNRTAVTVTVNPNPTASISQNINTLHASPNTGTETYQWLFNGTLMTGSIDDTLEATQNGNYQVIVTNNTGCVDTSSVFSFILTSIAQEKGFEFQVYPNPNQGKFTVSFSESKNWNVTLYDLTGKAVLHSEFVGFSHDLDLSHLPSQTYMLVIQTSGKMESVKIIKN